MPMPKHLDIEPEDPRAYLALSILDEAFKNIKAYYFHKGTIEELQAGKEAITWIRKMQGTYRMVALASKIRLDDFHQMCLWKINEIRQEAVEAELDKKYARPSVAEKDK